MGTAYHLCRCYKAFFNNHGSIAEEQEFECHEGAKLLASGAVTGVTRADLMV